MSIIIREVGAPASEWVYLDNTTNYTDRQSKRLTSNPIENRSVVADHAIKDNRKFSIAGSISPWDFHLAGGVNRVNSDGLAAVTSVGTIKVDKTISDYLPSVVSQYSDFSAEVKSASFGLSTPSVSRTAYLTSVQTRLQNLYETDGLIDVYFSDYSGEGERLIQASVITSIVFSEDLNTGDSKRIDLSFEKPVIAYVSTADIPAALNQELAELESKGDATSNNLTPTSSPTAYQQATNKLSTFFQ